MRNIAGKLWCVTLLVLLALGGRAQDTLSRSAKDMMLRLNRGVAANINGDKHSPDHGGVWCPGCNLYHTRAAEALYPLAYEYKLTGNKERLKQAMGLGDWLIRQQKPEGQWLETPEEWTGTTTDQLLMMLLAWPIVEPHMTKAQRAAWMASMEAAGDYLSRVMDNTFASINYCATTTATLAEMNRLVPKQTYSDKARELARMIVAKMNPEYFIEGEGGREGKFKYGIDLGYNLEMSLWGLARYAVLTGDGFVMEAVARSAANHLWFIFPDGTLDASSGIRSNKWTVWGSGTSDGCHPLMAMLADRDDAYIVAAVRNIGNIGRSFTKYGLLGMGPHYDLVQSKPPCIYPTFTKAKSMAMAIEWKTRDVAVRPLIPTDTPAVKFFPTTNTAVVRTKNLCASLTAYNYKAKEGPASKYMHRPTGGAMSALWVEGFGLLQAASQTEYHRWEPMSFPVLEGVRPLTPRIEVTLPGGGLHTNLYEYDAAFSVSQTPGGARATAYGQLKNRNQAPCGVGYTLSHVFGGDFLRKEYVIAHQTVDSPVQIVEPIVWGPDTRITQTSPTTVAITKGAKTVTLTLAGNATMRIDTGDKGYQCNIYPAVRALPIIIDVPCDPATRRETMTLTYSIR